MTAVSADIGFSFEIVEQGPHLHILGDLALQLALRSRELQIDKPLPAALHSIYGQGMCRSEYSSLP